MKVLVSKLSPKIRGYHEHSHGNYELVVNLTGAQTVCVEGTVYRLGEGDVMLIPPSVSHKGWSEQDFSDISAVFDTSDFEGFVMVHDGDGNVRTLMGMVHKIMMDRPRGYEELCAELMECICRYVKILHDGKVCSPLVGKVKELIQKNLSDPDFSIAEQIELLGYNADYVRRLFKAELGETPFGYMTHLRLSQARRLLLYDSAFRIEEIAARCGFADAFYFSTAFKKRYGESPSAYRKRGGD